MLHFSRIFKIKAGKLDAFKKWMNELSTVRKEEAIATFAYEHVTREIFALFKGTDGTHYAIGMNEASENYRPGDPNVPINQTHDAIKKECLEPITERGEVLLDLEAH